MRIKHGVKLAGLVPQIVFASIVVDGIYQQAFCECVVTSGSDSKHGANTLHTRDGLCRALDYRTKTYTLSKLDLVAKVKDALGTDFDVVLENIGEDNEHLHVEYDPKEAT